MGHRDRNERAPTLTKHTYSGRLVTSGDEAITLSDVLFGDTFVCSGQSNMALFVGSTFNQAVEVRDSAQFGATLRIMMVKTDNNFGTVTTPQINTEVAILTLTLTLT